MNLRAGLARSTTIRWHANVLLLYCSIPIPRLPMPVCKFATREDIKRVIELRGTPAARSLRNCGPPQRCAALSSPNTARMVSTGAKFDIVVHTYHTHKPPPKLEELVMRQTAAGGGDWRPDLISLACENRKHAFAFVSRTRCALRVSRSFACGLRTYSYYGLHEHEHIFHLVLYTTHTPIMSNL